MDVLSCSFHLPFKFQVCQLESETIMLEFTHSPFIQPSICAVIQAAAITTNRELTFTKFSTSLCYKHSLSITEWEPLLIVVEQKVDFTWQTAAQEVSSSKLRSFPIQDAYTVFHNTRVNMDVSFYSIHCSTDKALTSDQLKSFRRVKLTLTWHLSIAAVFLMNRSHLFQTFDFSIKSMNFLQ